MMNTLLQEITRFYEGWLAAGQAGAKSSLETDMLRTLVKEMQSLGPQQATQPRILPMVETWFEYSLKLPTATHCTPLVTTLTALSQQFHWVPVPVDYLGPHFATEFAYTQIIGPPVAFSDEVLFANGVIAVGFSLQAPHVFYPPHNHKALEFYGVLTGTARWQVCNSIPVAQSPGSYIFHDNDVPHAMETSAEPLLTIWAWLGELASPINVPSKVWL
jgi:hypothetical protein